MSKNKYSYFGKALGQQKTKTSPSFSPPSPPAQPNFCSINSKANNSYLMTSEEQGHLKIAHSHWTPPYRIK
jgi:hypothetical protein